MASTGIERTYSAPATSRASANAATSPRRESDQAISFAIMAPALPSPVMPADRLPCSVDPLPISSAHVEAHPHLQHQPLHGGGEVGLGVEQVGGRRDHLVARS